jgi:MerR family transcriptional regulator/heat shock protein HspR
MARGRRAEAAAAAAAERASPGSGARAISGGADRDPSPDPGLYEREGLLKPSRTEGNTRLYSEEDLKQLEVILNLTRDLGVNLAGIEIVLNMRRKMEQMQAEVSEFVEYVRQELVRAKAQGWEDRFEKALVKLPPAPPVSPGRAREGEGGVPRPPVSPAE